MELRIFFLSVFLQLLVVVTFSITPTNTLSTVFVLETSNSDHGNHNHGEEDKTNDTLTRIITDNQSSSEDNGGNNENHHATNNSKSHKATQRLPDNQNSQLRSMSSNDHETSSSSSSQSEHQSTPKHENVDTKQVVVALKHTQNNENHQDLSAQQVQLGSSTDEHQHSSDNVNHEMTQSESNNEEQYSHTNSDRNKKSDLDSNRETNARRIDVSTHPKAKATQNQNTRTTNRPRVVTTTSTSRSLDDDQTNSHETAAAAKPKVEERLLISISSDDDDSGPPQKVSSGSGNLHANTGTTRPSSAPNSPKRKSTFTISIHDANKQSGSPSVVVRPGEDGQSIVISTVNAGDHNNNKKPLSSTSSSGQHNNDPYREPINTPTSLTSSTTRRPSSLNNNYNPNLNRPILNDNLPNHNNDERPQRPPPMISSDDNSYSSSIHSKPTSRPVITSDNYEGGSSSSSSSGSSAYDNDHNSGSNSGGYIDVPSTNEIKFPLNEDSCGLIHETRIVGGDEADPRDFLWMTAIVKSRPKDGEPKPFCGGSLITRRHILTAAHCLEGLAPRDVLVRLGSYDFDDSTARSSSVDFAIDQFRTPAQYNKKTHIADIAIMRLKTPLTKNDNYKPVCMPQPRRSYVGELGVVTGYGSQSQTFRRATPKLRQVTVPIWENRKCSLVYKRNLTDSFLCAGFEEGGKDACQGDSGGPLMTEGPNQRMMIVGVVSHGIGCGSPGYPGVYTRTTAFTDWIEKNTRE